MNLPRISALVLGLSLLLTACPGTGTTPIVKPPPETETQLTEANAWKGDIPADAETVTPEAFKAGLASGELALTPTATLEQQKAAREKQYQDDKSFLSALPEKSPYVQALLASAADLSSADTDVPKALAGGRSVGLMSLAQQLRGAVEAYQRGQDPQNALEAYTTSYSLLPDDLKAKADSPESLKGKSLEAIQAAASKLDGLLSSVPNLDGTRLDTDTGSASLPGGLSSTAVNPGNGMDNSGSCTPTGYAKTYWFPLKKFVSPIKDQGQRGTCWAFAAIGALESREQVQNNNPANLSEQFLVNKVKQDWQPSDDSDGYSAVTALETAVSKGQVFPSEGAWTYNPANSRPYPKYDNTCAGYSGTCSETAHESRRTCTTFIFKFCSYVKVTFGGPGIASSGTHLEWKSGDAFNLNNYLLLLANGHTLLADFPVYKGFDEATGAGGVVSNYTTDTTDGKKAGGHVVQFVGFLSNDDLTTFGNPAKVGGGGYFILKNSWGCVGDGGYYYVPADYVQKYFGSLSTLNFGTQRSSRWIQEQKTPGGTDAPTIVLKNQPATADLRVETGLAKFFTVAHPVAKSVTLTVTSSVDGSLYNGPWSTDTNALFGSELKKTFATPGTRTLTLSAKYGSSQVSKSFNVNVVNTPPTLELQNSGDAHQGEDYPITAVIKDINEPDLNKLCANTLWSADAPDSLSSAVGCTVKFKAGAQGARQVRVSTRDSEGAVGSSSVTLNVLPPPENPYPKIVSSGVYSREFVGDGSVFLRNCTDVAVNSGSTIDLRRDGCTFSVLGTPPLRYSAAVAVENPTGEALTFDWKFFATNVTGDYNLYSDIASKVGTFTLYSPGNATLVTNDCRVTLKVNAPDLTRSKGPITVWSGKCTYNATRLN